jgi:hypothetical protein
MLREVMSDRGGTAGSGAAPGAPAPDGPLARFFRFVIAHRLVVLAFYALLLPVAIVPALRVGQDNALDRLIVTSDPDYVATKEFEKVFGSGAYIVLLAQAPDIFAPDVLGRIDSLETRLAAIPGVEPQSALTAFRRAKAGFTPTPEQAAAFRAFVTGTTLFKEQGLVADGILAIPVVLRPSSEPVLSPSKDVLSPSKGVRAILAEVDSALDDIERHPAPLTALGKIGDPYVNRYLDESTARETNRYFPIFGLLLLALNLALYRSLRTLVAFVITLGFSVAATMGAIGLTGGTLTIVSPLVPVTILVTCTATLVYIHSRYVDRPAGVPEEQHQVFALVNKFTACTASIFATAVGFAALAVSSIPPIRDLGIWVAMGLVMTWIAVFTLFPALQRILKTPTRPGGTAESEFFHRFAEWLPGFSYRWRWPLVTASLLLSAAGAAAIFGIPGLLAPMHLTTEGLEYIDQDTALYKDTRRFERVIAGLSLTEVWLSGPTAGLTDPAVLRGLDSFQESLAASPEIGSVAGPTKILRMLNYLGGGGDRFPTEPVALAKVAADLELLLPTEPALAGFVDKTLSQTHVAVISRSADDEGFRRIDASIRARWAEAVGREPALGGFTLKTVGSGPLQARISYHLVPTLVESFVLTAAIIFGAFLIVFRSGPARLMAMIPSLFAILVMFGVMRVTGMSLNVATILIASTVLGTSENDQIHFFYHFLEERRRGSVASGLRHTLRIAGKAIFYATMINAGGFLAFVFATLPPLRQFGILTALAFGLSMLADFTALPAALWIVYRERPEEDHARVVDPKPID